MVHRECSGLNLALVVIGDRVEMVVVLEEDLPPAGHGRGLVDFAALDVDGTLERDHLAGNEELSLLGDRVDDPRDQPLSDVDAHVI